MEEVQSNIAPWAITEKPLQIVDANGITVAKLTSLDLPNARRIVACINACASIPTYQLTIEDDKPNDLGAMIDQLRTL